MNTDSSELNQSITSTLLSPRHTYKDARDNPTPTVLKTAFLTSASVLQRPRKIGSHDPASADIR